MKVTKPKKSKVVKPATERDKTLAMRLGFLRQARRVTLQTLADSNGTQRSNLSAFVTSGGKIRNVAYDKLDRILFTLGMLPDGTLTPILHRWHVDPEVVSPMCEILKANEYQTAVLMKLSSGAGYLAVKVTGNILVFASLDAGTLEPVEMALAEKVQKITLDRSGDSSIQSMWMTTDNDAHVQKFLLSILKG